MNDTPTEIEKDRITPILSTFLVLFGIMIGLLLLLRFWKEDADMFIVPAGYTGKITVVYNQPTGMPEKYIGKKRAFEIPPSGILRTQAPYKGKWNLYYYRLLDGSLLSIPESPFAHKDAAPPISPPTIILEDTVEIREIELNSKPERATFSIVRIN